MDQLEKILFHTFSACKSVNLDSMIVSIPLAEPHYELQSHKSTFWRDLRELRVRGNSFECLIAIRPPISVTDTSVFALSSFLCFSLVVQWRDYNCVSCVTLTFASRFLFAFFRDSGSLRLGILFFRFFQFGITLHIVKYFESINSL